MNRLFVMFIAALLVAGLQTTRAQQNSAGREAARARAAQGDGRWRSEGAIEEYKIVAGAAQSGAGGAGARPDGGSLEIEIHRFPLQRINKNKMQIVSL